MSTSTRVIKNTVYLYFKMGLTMFVSLYTTRLILASLGASDFGIYNVVGGVIAMLCFLNTTMANATQRFMSYAEGEGRLETKRTIFNVSVIIHLAIALATIIILLIAMYPLFNGIFNIEADRKIAAIVVYFCLIFSTVLTIINVPYDAVMNAHENMLYYSVVGIFESLLKLAVAYFCVYTSRDKLIIYGILMAFIPLITLTIMKIYCHQHYEECVFAPKRYWNGTTVKQISVFSGWNFLTAISSLFSVQGVAVLLNHYFGPILNAAQGVAGQVNGALAGFSTNLLKALNPVIVKSAGANDIYYMNRTALTGCKYSTLLMLFFSMPLILEVDYILGLWLEKVPEWANIFVILILARSILNQMANSFGTAIYAQGDIKKYSVAKSVLYIIPLIITWVAFFKGGGVMWLYIPMIIISDIGGGFCIIYYTNKKCDLKVEEYIKMVLLPISGTIIVMLLFGLCPVCLMTSGVWRLFLTVIATTLGMVLSGILFAVTKEEKHLLYGIIIGVLNRSSNHSGLFKNK